MLFKIVEGKIGVMKKICVCALLIWAVCSIQFTAFANTPGITEYDTISPINLTISSFERMYDTDSQVLFENALRHFAVALHEMTNGAHRLGRIKILQPGTLRNRELLHINWLEYHRRTGLFSSWGETPSATVEIKGSYVTFGQNAGNSSIRMDHAFLRGRSYGIQRSGWGPIDTGYTLAHEAGHFIYGLFDEYGTTDSDFFAFVYQPHYGDGFYDRWPDPINSIMAEQAQGYSAALSYRARALNFSTMAHYDYVGTRDQINTPQRRMFPNSISGWDTLVSTEMPQSSSHSRSLFRDLRDVKPTTGLYITHSDSFPPYNAQAADFAGLPAVASLDIRWGTTDNQRARLFLVGGEFTEEVDLLDWLPKEFLPLRYQENPVVNWRFDQELRRRMGSLANMMAYGSHVGVKTLGRDSMIDTLTLRRITGRGTVEQVVNSISNFSGTTEIPLYDHLYYAISGLQRYMNNNEILLGDIVVLLGSQTPEESERLSRNVPLRRLIEKSRRHFIPIHIQGFNIGHGEDYKILARNTGGVAFGSFVPVNPERFQVINDRIWRGFTEDPFPLLNPWNGHLQFAAVGSAGRIWDDGWSRAIMPYATSGSTLDLESNVQWRPADSGNEAPPVPRNARSGIIAPHSINEIDGRPFFIDSHLNSFWAKIRIANPHDRDIEVVLRSTSSGEEHPVAITWRGQVGYAVTNVNLNNSSRGFWRVIARGVDWYEAQMTYQIVGESRGLFAEEDGLERRSSTSRPYGGALATSISVQNLSGNIYDKANGLDLFVTVMTHEGRTRLTNLDVTVEVQFPNGARDWIPMSDDGVWPDELGRDGIYTGILRLSPFLTGQMVLTAIVNNPTNGTATPTYLSSMRIGIDEIDLDGEPPFWGEPITERFQRKSQVVFQVVGNAPTTPRLLPQFETTRVPLRMLGDIHIPVAALLSGVETEISVDITPQGLIEPLANHFSWSDVIGVDLIPDPEGRPNVIRVRPHANTHGLRLFRFSSTVPNALRGLVEAQTVSRHIPITVPLFEGTGFRNQGVESIGSDSITVFVGEEAFYNMRLVLPEGYDSRASWSKNDPNNIAQLISYGPDWYSFRANRLGTFSFTLRSDAFPEQIGRTINVRALHREGPGGQGGLPGDGPATGPDDIPGMDDPGGDDDVDTGAGGGGGGGGSGPPNREPEYPELREPVLLPPEVSRITLGGYDITIDGVRIVKQWERIPLVFEFREPIDRYTLAAVLASETPPMQMLENIDSATASLGNKVLSADGMELTCIFIGKAVGLHRIIYRVERRDGIQATGDFVLQVVTNPNLDAPQEYYPCDIGQGGGGSGGGSGCNATGAGLAVAILALAILLFRKGIWLKA